MLKSKIRENALQKQDLAGTGFADFWEYYSNSPHEIDCTDIQTFFQNLADVNLSAEGCVYAFIDYGAEDQPAYFFDNYDAIVDLFCDFYAAINSWEDMEDNELEEWIEAMEDGCFKDREVTLLTYPNEE